LTVNAVISVKKKKMKTMNELLVFIKTLTRSVWDREKPTTCALEALCAFLNRDAVIYDPDGDVLTDFAPNPADAAFARQLFGVPESVYNLNMPGDRFALATPLIAGAERMGTLFVYGDGEFDETAAAACEICALVAALCLRARSLGVSERENAVSESVRVAIDALSHTELEAAIAIFNELNGKEGVVVASSVSKRENVTRSSIVNAIRKLESAGVVESRSLGAKGTYILVKNGALLKHLKKFSKVR
jgi:hypothetical protein